MKELDFVRKHVKEAMSLYYSNHPTGIVEKAEFDLVTDIDKKIEDYLVKKINEEFPNDSILAEETKPSTKLSGRVWTIDPIDGTVNMAHGIQINGIQMSLVIDNEITFAYMYFPNFNDEYYAIKGEGCYYNNERCYASKEKDLSKSLVSFGDFSHRHKDLADKEYKVVGGLYKEVQKIRLLGSAAVDFSLAARGAVECCVVLTDNLWDILPGILLCREAGAKVSNLLGNDYKLYDRGIIVTKNMSLLDKIVKLFE